MCGTGALAPAAALGPACAPACQARRPALTAALRAAAAPKQGIGVTLALELCLTDLRRVLELRGNEPLDPALAKSVIQQLLRAVHACHQAGELDPPAGSAWLNCPFATAPRIAPPGPTLRRLQRCTDLPGGNSGRRGCPRRWTLAMHIFPARPAHTLAGYMHRDIAPSNLLVARGSGLIKLSDFGQARGSVSADGGAATSAAHAADAAGGEGHMSPTVGTLW